MRIRSQSHKTSHAKDSRECRSPISPLAIRASLTRFWHIQTIISCFGCHGGFKSAKGDIEASREIVADKEPSAVVSTASPIASSVETVEQVIVPNLQNQENKMNAASCPEMQDLQASPPDLPFESISSPEQVPGSSSLTTALNKTIPVLQVTVIDSIEDLFASGDFKIEADNAVEKITSKTRLPPTITRMPSTLSRGYHLESLMESDPQGVRMRRALNQSSATGSAPTSPRKASDSTRARSHSQHRAFVEGIERIAHMHGQGVPDYEANLARWKAGEEKRMRTWTNYMHIRKVLANGGGSPDQINSQNYWLRPLHNQP